MSKYLVIVESPAKAKTIKKFLGADYKVIASMGHVRDLPESHLGVDVNEDFKPMYVIKAGKSAFIKEIKSDSEKADKVFLATDPDREGEAISWHLANILKINPQEDCRISFNEITKNAVFNAVMEPRPLDMDLVNAQQARRILDRVVGYEISPILWKKIRKGLSAGRVQSVTTRIICDRETLIDNFVPEEYWSIDLKFKKEDGLIFAAKFHGRDGKKEKINNKKESDEIVSLLKDSDFIVSKVKKSKKRRNPAAPFITSTLQQESSRKLGFSAQKTMMIAQQLYEGVEIGDEGAVGLITYMRTDSVRISDDALDQARSYILENFGSEYLPTKPKVYKKKTASQDAHEAIRPSYIDRSPDSLKRFLSMDQYKVYKLIWDRFLACQMQPAVFDTISVQIDGNPKSKKDTVLNLRTSGSKLVFKGFMALYLEGTDIEEEDDDTQVLPEIKEKEDLALVNTRPNQHFTEPPARYTEASLVKALEENGIGRPSTYAPTINTIINRGYIERNKKQLVPTELGKIVNQLMVANFADVVSINFTAEMESNLDKIEVGKIEWKSVLNDFYTPFKETVRKAESIERVEMPVEESDEICDKCGKQMVIKMGRFGKFLACPGFPECKNTKPFLEEAGVKCPKCGGRVVYRKTKRNRKYLGCENYPKCDFMTWDMPSDKTCLKCSNFLTQKKKANIITYKCSNSECDYIIEEQKG